MDNNKNENELQSNQNIKSNYYNKNIKENYYPEKENNKFINNITENISNQETNDITNRINLMNINSYKPQNNFQYQIPQNQYNNNSMNIC